MPPPGVFVVPYLPWHNNHFFMSINGRIKKSAGCRGEFSDPFDPIFVELVVQHVEREYYNDKNRFRQIGNEQAWYYHPLRACLMARHQNFNSAMIQLHPEVLVMICKQVSYIRISASTSVLHFKFKDEDLQLCDQPRSRVRVVVCFFKLRLLRVAVKSDPDVLVSYSILY